MAQTFAKVCCKRFTVDTLLACKHDCLWGKKEGGGGGGGGGESRQSVDIIT